MTNSLVYVKETNAVDNFIHGGSRYREYETLYLRYVEYLIRY